MWRRGSTCAQKALGDIAIFCLGFGIVVYGFGFSGFLLFGHGLVEFHSIPASTSSLARFVLGAQPRTPAPVACGHRADCIAVRVTARHVLRGFEWLPRCRTCHLQATSTTKR